MEAMAGRGFRFSYFFIDDSWKSKRDKGVHPEPTGFAATCEARNIVVENNLISTSPNMAVLVTAAADVAIRNNRFENAGCARLKEVRDAAGTPG